MRQGVKRLIIAALAGAACAPGAALAQIATGAEPGQGAPADAAPEPAQDVSAEIVPDAEFEAAMPQVDGDIDAPIAPLPADTAIDAATPGPEELAPIAEEEAEFSAPLPPVSEFEVVPVAADAAAADEEDAAAIRYATVVEGLDALDLDGRFRDLSALEKGDGRAANAAIVAARAREDERLAQRLLYSRGYYDGTAISVIEQDPANPGRLRAVLSATPGEIYRLGSVRVQGPPGVPAGLIDSELPLRIGDPIDADRIQGAEANLSLKLPQMGYPFVELGQRDILLDETTHRGDYLLPVDTGPRVSFGRIVTQGRRPVFEAEHIQVLARFERGELYDSRKVDDLREALIATSLFSTVSVEPVRTGEAGPDGTEVVNLNIVQRAGPPRTLAGELGYSTGQGLRAEASWTHRNLFPPEGALILTGVLGTQEQGASATFRRSNWRRRDRTLQVALAANHSDYEAYRAYTGSLSARISRDSTPIWQKRWTWYYGAEIVGSNEDRYNYALGRRDRGTWLITALPAFLGYDTSDDLLNPTRGFRLKANVSPETSVRGAARPYARLMVEGTAYYPLSDSLVIAGRARTGTILGIGRDDLPPSRRYYAGGGGSVRGFAYQELGPRSPDGKPVGGRSVVEGAIEARYRFGNFGIVPFVDAGQVYEGITPTGGDIRFGAGVGGRFYTNFGPVRVDVATPIARRPNEARVTLYISIGQAF
ncbi:MAG: BamA/TamA family outer membrane protein [Sphingomonas sp.]